MANGLTNISRMDVHEFKKIEPHSAGISAIHVPYTGIIDYTDVAEKYASLFMQAGGKVFTDTKVLSVKDGQFIEVKTSNENFSCEKVVNCAGLFSDRILSMCGIKPQIKILPFRGEYFVVKRDKQHLVKHLIYPVPDPQFPFLGVHFTRFIKGGLEAGPNAVLAYAREGYTKTNINFYDLWEVLSFTGFHKLAARYWRIGLGEFHRSYSKAAFTKALQRLIPDVTETDLVPAEAGVRASATDADGNVVDDFVIQKTHNMVHVLNSPSPAATASLAIGEHVAGLALS
jgi:(S)-2-hydroxyglutarate dehydrogenase